MLHLDAEALYTELRAGVRRLWQPRRRAGGHLVGRRLAGRAAAGRPAGLPGKAGVISSTLHRDDFGEPAAWPAGPDATKLPFAIDGRHIVLVDDVLFTGRTIRAVINELYDFGRPASVTLAVLVDRGGRELPIEPAFAAARIAAAGEQTSPGA
jgi:pyrimidine operon attenuation protein/uracil phosphoribosyltransferase